MSKRDVGSVYSIYSEFHQNLEENLQPRILVQESLDSGSYVSADPSCGAAPFRKLQNFELRSREGEGGGAFHYLVQWESELGVWQSGVSYWMIFIIDQLS